MNAYVWHLSEQIKQTLNARDQSNCSLEITFYKINMSPEVNLLQTGPSKVNYDNIIT